MRIALLLLLWLWLWLLLLLLHVWVSWRSNGAVWWLLLLLTVPGISYEQALTAPGGGSWQARSVDWLRDHGGSSVVNAVDRMYPSSPAPGSRKRCTHFPDAVSWTPPCETQHSRWTLDVWYLLAFDGRVGTGRSFLIDLVDNLVVTSRDFSVRTG